MVRTTSTIAMQRMAYVPEDKRFWCIDGRTLKNLQELATALEEMSDDTYRFHSNEKKTDFSNWVREVIGDDKLARDLLKSATRLQAAKVVKERLDWLKEKANSS